MGKPKAMKPKTNTETASKPEVKSVKKDAIVKKKNSQKNKDMKKKVESVVKSEEVNGDKENRLVFLSKFKNIYLETLKKMMKKKLVKVSEQDFEYISKLQILPIVKERFENVIKHTKVDQENLDDCCKVFETALEDCGPLPPPKKNRINLKRKSAKAAQSAEESNSTSSPKKKEESEGDSSNKEAPDSTPSSKKAKKPKNKKSADETSPSVEANSTPSPQKGKKSKKEGAQMNNKPKVETITETASTKERVAAAKEQKLAKSFGKNKKKSGPKKPSPKKTN